MYFALNFFLLGSEDECVFVDAEVAPVPPGEEPMPYIEIAFHATDI